MRLFLQTASKLPPSTGGVLLPAILLMMLGECLAVNYDMFGFDSSASDFRMDPALIWDEDSVISCMDVSPTGDLVIGGRNPEMFVSKKMSLVYTESSTDFSSKRINETNTWALGYSYNTNDTWFNRCIFTPSTITGLSHRYIIAEYIRATSVHLRAFMVIDPKASNENGFLVKMHFYSDHNSYEHEYEDLSKSEKLNDVFGILQETNIITLYRTTMYSNRMYISKFIINTSTWEYVADPTSSYTLPESTTSTYRRLAFLQQGYHFYFSVSYLYSSSQQRTVLGRFVECGGCADLDNLSKMATAYSSSTGGSILYYETLSYPSMNSKVLKSIEVMAFNGRMIAMGGIRQGVEGDVSSVNFGVLRFITWCPSRIEKMDINLPTNEQINPLALYAKSVEDSYMFGVVDSASEGRKLKIVKVNYPQDSSCSKQSYAFSASASLVNLELELFSPTDIAQVILAKFDSSFSALFIGGKAASMKNSAAVNRGFLDGVSLGYIDSLATTTLTTSSISTQSSGSMWSVTSSKYTRPNSTIAVEAEKHQCYQSVSLVEDSWLTSGHVLDIINSTSQQTFPADEIFKTNDQEVCPLTTCTTQTYSDTTLLYDLTHYNQASCTAAHASNITWATDPTTSKLSASFEIAAPYLDYKVSFKCGNEHSTVQSHVFSIKVTDPCETIEITALAGSLPKEKAVPQRIFITQDDVRHDPDDGQKSVVLPLDTFPDPSQRCPVRALTIAKVLEDDGSTVIAESSWSPIISLVEEAGVTSLKVVPPAGPTLLPFEVAQVYIAVHLDSQMKEFHFATIDLTADIELNKEPFFDSRPEDITLSFEYYPVGADPTAQQQPAEDETMEIIPPTKTTYTPLVFQLPAANDSNNFDYVASITTDIPLSMQSCVTFSSATNSTEFAINAFSFSQAQMTGFSVIYILTDRWGLSASFTQVVTIDVKMVYEERVFTKIPKKEDPSEEEPVEEEEEEVEEEEEEEEAPSGPVFPGFIISEEQVAAWAGEENVPPPVGEEKKFVPLRASISDITTLGLFTVQFNQAIQGDLFELENIGDSLFFEIVPGDYEKSPYFDISNLGFVWEAVEFDEGKNLLLFQVNFTNAMYISTEDAPDEMVIRVINPDAFKSVEFDTRISYGSKNMWSPVKKQMPNNEASQNYDQGTTTTQESMSAATIFTFCLNLFFRGSMKEIIGTILSLQIIINLFLLTIPFPANSSNLVSKLKPIVSFDILKTFTEYTTDYLPLDVDQQAEFRSEILASAQSMGTKSHNAIPNLGNMFHLLAFYLWMVLFLTYYKFRGLGSIKWGHKHTAIKQRLCCGQLLNILISGFLPITIAVYYQFRHPLFTTIGERIGVAFGIFFFCLEHVFFPLALVWILTVPREVLDKPDFKTKWGLLYTKARYNTLAQRAYLHVFILRRLLLLYIGLQMYGQPPFQLVAINVLNLCVIIYTGLAEPQKSLHSRRMELFNEGMVALITYNLFMFTDALPDRSAQYFIGWVFAGSLVVMLAGNSIFVVKNTIRRMYLLMMKRLKKFDFMRKKAQSAYDEEMKQLRDMQAKLQAHIDANPNFEPKPSEPTQMTEEFSSSSSSSSSESKESKEKPRKEKKNFPIRKSALKSPIEHLSVIREVGDDDDDQTEMSEGDQVRITSLEKTPTADILKRQKAVEAYFSNFSLKPGNLRRTSLRCSTTSTPASAAPQETSRPSKNLGHRMSISHVRQHLHKSSDFSNYLNGRLSRRHELRMTQS